MVKCPTESELYRLLARWQEMLRLQQWKIKIRYARSREMCSDEGNIAWGRCRVNENHLKAEVTVLHPEDYEDDEGRLEIEATIAHELLHLLMYPTRRPGSKGPSEAEDIAEEQMINVCADRLVSLFHAKRGKAA